MLTCKSVELCGGGQLFATLFPRHLLHYRSQRFRFDVKWR